MIRTLKYRRFTAHWNLLFVLLIPMVAGSLHAQTDSDFDEYKIRLGGYWSYSNPSGTLQDATSGTSISLHKDFGFG
jgi:hypothetical protein